MADEEGYARQPLSKMALNNPHFLVFILWVISSPKVWTGFVDWLLTNRIIWQK